MKTIGIVGSRRRNSSKDLKAVSDALVQIYEPGDELVSGGCPLGADSFAQYLAKQQEIAIKIYYAKWKTIGKSAGFVRNTYIARDADYLIACVADDRTGGTEDTISKFEGELILV